MNARSEHQQHRAVIGAAPPLAASMATVARRVIGGTLARQTSSRSYRCASLASVADGARPSSPA